MGLKQISGSASLFGDGKGDCSQNDLCDSRLSAMWNFARLTQGYNRKSLLKGHEH